MKFFAGMTVAVFFLAFPASDIRADSQNYQNYVVGERAAGMGGAYTAFSDSAEGTLYNPGGIVFAPDDTISLSGNIIRYTTGTVEGGLVINPTTSKDVKISDMKVTPASSVGLKKFKKQALALSFYKPDATNYSGQEELTSGGTDALFNYRIDDTLLLAGPTYSRKFNDRLGIGISAFYGYRKIEFEQFIMANVDATFTHRFSLSDYNYGSLLGVIGAKWDASDKFSLGFAARPPSVRLHGSGKIYQTTATLDSAGATTSTKTVLDGLVINAPLPVKFTGGVGYQNHRRLALACDVSLYLPNTYSEAHDPQGRRGDAVVHQNLVVNANVGGEYRLGKYYPVRAGFFTNFSSADNVKVGGTTQSKINYYGGALAIAREKPKHATQAGLQLAYGKGDILVGNSVNKFTLLHLTAMLATSFRF